MTAFTVVRGAPDEEEIAALAAVLLLLRRARPAPPPRNPVRWRRSGSYAPPGAWTSR